MSVLKQNIIANIGANIWIGLIHLAFVPLYIHFIGMEAYGLVGFFTILLALFAPLDAGLSTTLNREMARLAPRTEKSQEMRDLLRTIEIPYWLVAILIAIAVVRGSSFIAYHWVNVEGLDPERVRVAVMLMGLSVALQWPIGLYSGGLMGLQRQVLLNIANVAVATVRGGGAVFILWLVSPTVEAFFLWQIGVSTVHVGIIATLLWRSLPSGERSARFRRELLVNTWRFAGGMTAVTFIYLIVTQADKVILSKILTLEEFGYYSLASVVVIGLARLTTPLYLAVFPHFSQLVSLRDEIGLIQSYHKVCQFLSVASLPVAMMFIFFPSEVLLLWTGNSVTVSNTYSILRLLSVSAALSGLLYIPQAFILSHGCTKIYVYINGIAIFVLVPLIYILTTLYGVLGAPSALIFFYFFNVFITIHVIHSRFLKGEKWKWYLHDVGKPLAAGIAMACFWRVIIPSSMSRVSILIFLIWIFLTILGAAAFATSSTRFWIVQTFAKLFPFPERKQTDAKQ